MSDAPVPSPASPAPPPEPAAAVLPAPTPIQRVELWLRNRRRFIISVLAGASILLRIVYYLELKDGPCLRAHEWTQTDMHFFDTWARAISGGDWLSRGEYHPLMRWQQDAARIYFEQSPHAAAEFELPANDELALHRALWNRWQGGLRFHQEPLYVYLVAGTYSVFGPDVRWVFVWQMAIGILTNVLVYVLARRFFGEIAGAAAGVIVLLYSPLLFYELALVRTTLTAFLAIAMALAADHAMSRATARAWFGAGCCFGVSLLCQTTFATIVAGSAVLLVLRHRREPRNFLRLGGAMTGGVLLAMSPAVIRNVSVGAPPFGLAGVGTFVFVGLNESSARIDMGPPVLTPSQIAILGRTKGEFLPAVRESLRSHTISSYASLLAAKFAMHWHWYEEPDNQNLYYYRLHSAVLRNMPFTFLIIAPLALVGFVLALPDARRCSLLYLMIAGSIAIALLAIPISRYRVPFVAAMIPFAALTVARFTEWAATRRWRPLALALGAVLVLGVWTGRPLTAGRPAIRVADYTAPYGYYWASRIAASRDAATAVSIVEASLRYEPPELADIVKKPPTITGYQSELAEAYAGIYAAYADLLARAGRTTDAERAREVAALLHAAGLVRSQQDP